MADTEDRDRIAQALHRAVYKYFSVEQLGDSERDDHEARIAAILPLLAEARQQGAREGWDEGYWQGINGHTGPDNPYRDHNHAPRQEGER